MALLPGFEWIKLLQGVRTLDQQVALTVAVLLSAAIIARIIAPGIVQWTRAAFDRLMERENLKSTVRMIRRYTPWWTSMGAVIFLAQLTVGVLTAIALLAIWGQLDFAISILGLLSVSVSVLIQAGITLLVFLAAFVTIEILDAWLAGITERSEQFSQHQEEVAFRVLQIVVLVAVGFVVLSLWGVNLGGLLVGAGFLGIVAGLAAQQTLGSLIAGFVLMFSRPFEIGDWIEVGNNEGIVTEITIVNTRLENFDGEFIVIPNDQVGNATVINRSRKGRLRIRVEVGVDYESDPERAQEIAEERLKDVDEILSVPRPQAITKRLGDSAVILELRFWIDKPSARRRARATSAAIRAVKEAYLAEGIKIPYPQRELSGREETGGFRVVDAGTEAGD